MNKKIIVVGANHAGTAAINTMLDNYKNVDVTVFDENSNISFLGCGIALWIGKQIDGPDGLFYSSKEALEAKGAKVHMETQVTKIDYDKKIVYAKSKVDGEMYEESYDKLILATGSLPIIPKINGLDLENVQFIKLFQDAQDIINKLLNKTIKHVTIVGGGYIGVELAEAFKRYDKEITIVDNAEHCLANYYDDDFTIEMENVLTKHGVELRLNETVKEIKGETKVEKIVTDKGEFNTDMIIFCIGFKPNTEIGDNKISFFGNSAFKVDATQKTNLDDVYAIGDCATVYDNSINETNYIALATNALRSGIIAAHNVCGTRIQSPGVQGSNGISIWEYKMVSTGITMKKAKSLGIDADCVDAEDLQKPGFIKENEKVKLRIVFDKKTRRILGAQMASFYDMSMGIHMFSLAIQEHLTIDRIKLLDILFLPHFNQPYNYISQAALEASFRD